MADSFYRLKVMPPKGSKGLCFKNISLQSFIATRQSLNLPSVGKFFVASMFNVCRMVSGHHAMAFAAHRTGNLTVKIPLMAAFGTMVVIMTTGLRRQIAQRITYRTMFVARFVTIKTHFKAPFLTYFKFNYLTLIFNFTDAIADILIFR